MNEEFANIKSIEYKELSLIDVIILSQRDDLKALEELIKRVQNNVYATLCYLEDKNFDPLDLTQEVLIRMSKNIKSLKKPNFFKSWLNQITMHVFYDYLRKKNRQILTLSIDEQINSPDEHSHITEIPDTHKRPEDATLTNELDTIIQESIYKLPVSFRLPIILRELQGMSYEEIANSLNTNIGTIKSRISRARNKLQEDLKPYIA